MIAEIPKIEQRDFEGLLNDFKALVPFYTSEWRLEVDEKGADTALVKIFIHLLMTIYSRLNRLPEKHFISFLDKIGVKLIPAQPAFVPVTFVVSEGAGEHVLVPERTQVAAGDVIFETEKNLLAAPARLVDIYSIDGELDTIFRSPANIITGEPVLPADTQLLYTVEPGEREMFLESLQDLGEGDVLLIDGTEYGIVSALSDTAVTLTGGMENSHDSGTAVEKVTGFELFTGKDLQEHILYLGHNTLFEISDTIKITLYIDKKLADTTVFSWQYYGEDAAGVVDWHPLEVSAVEDGVVLAKKESGEIAELEIKTVSSRWLRCIARPPEKTLLAEVSINTVEVELSPLEEESPSDSALLPDLVYYYDVPADPAKISTCKPFYPFGMTPVLHDTCSIGSSEVFFRPGADIEITFGFAALGVPGDMGVLLAWEYYGETGWRVIKNLEDNTDNFTSAGEGDPGENGTTVGRATLKFKCPQDITLVDVNGEENYWLRVRLVDGDYGRETFVKTGTIWEQDYSNVKPPIIVELTLSYSQEIVPERFPLDCCLTFNNLEWIDRGKEIEEADKTFKPFIPLAEERRMFYLAFDEPLEKGPVSLFFAIEEKPVSPEQVPIIRWEYYSETQQWERLEGLDTTMSLTRTGVIEFVFPPGFREHRKFDSEAYWLRAVYERETASGSTDIAIPVINGVFLNTTLATQCETFSDEIVGSGDGTKDQVFHLEKVPVISGSEEIWIDEFKTISGEEQTRLEQEGIYPVKPVRDEKGELTEFQVRWRAIESIVNATADERCYELDNVSGAVYFGDGVYGKIPPTGADNIKANYRGGGGKEGNLSAFLVKDLKTSLPFLDSAFNPLAAGGGSDTETIERLMKRGPNLLKNRDRAVTPDDFEQLALQASGSIARVRCLSNTDDKRENTEGRVTVIVIPRTMEERPRLSLQLKQQVEQYLRQRAAYPLVDEDYLQVIGPVYAEVSVNAQAAAAAIEDVPVVEKECVSRLRAFLNPLTGGYEQGGWEFGKVPCFSDFYAFLEKIEGVDHVVDLSITLSILDPVNAAVVSQYVLTPEKPEAFQMPSYAVVCNGKHKIDVSI
jgi:hypothetical protein